VPFVRIPEQEDIYPIHDDILRRILGWEFGSEDRCALPASCASSGGTSCALLLDRARHVSAVSLVLILADTPANAAEAAAVSALSAALRILAMPTVTLLPRPLSLSRRKSRGAALVDAVAASASAAIDASFAALPDCPDLPADDWSDAAGACGELGASGASVVVDSGALAQHLPHLPLMEADGVVDSALTTAAASLVQSSFPLATASCGGQTPEVAVASRTSSGPHPGTFTLHMHAVHALHMQPASVLRTWQTWRR
jgi:hypothetical protein